MELRIDWSLKNILLSVFICGSVAILLRLCLIRRSEALTEVDPEIQSLVSSKVGEHVVMVFSKTYCPYCTKAKEALRKLNISYGVLELDVCGFFLCCCH